MAKAQDRILKWFMDGFDDAVGNGTSFERRVGAELKFPLVTPEGEAVPRETVDALWLHLVQECGWKPETDETTSLLVGARLPGPKNETVASCETGYCKTEFSLAHAADLFELEDRLRETVTALVPFAVEHNARFLCHGTLPVNAPGRDLLMKKQRASVWDKTIPSNNRIKPEDGDDVHLFTINAGSHVHVSVRKDQAVETVNVLNGFAGPQIALTAHSSIWKNTISDDYCCINEKLWDWWEHASARSGVPARPFTDIADYVRTVSRMRPIYARRPDGPVVLGDYDTFAEYFGDPEAKGRNLEGKTVGIKPDPADLSLHNSCYWFNARISRYYTVENRVFDQQPQNALLAPAALTLGLVENREEAWDYLDGFDWASLRMARDAACRDGLKATVAGQSLSGMAKVMLTLAENGLKKRRLGEERFLAPFKARHEEGRCPARDVRDMVGAEGISALVEAQSLCAAALVRS